MLFTATRCTYNVDESLAGRFLQGRGEIVSARLVYRRLVVDEERCNARLVVKRRRPEQRPARFVGRAHQPLILGDECR